MSCTGTLRFFTGDVNFYGVCVQATKRQFLQSKVRRMWQAASNPMPYESGVAVLKMSVISSTVYFKAERFRITVYFSCFFWLCRTIRLDSGLLAERNGLEQAEFSTESETFQLNFRDATTVRPPFIDVSAWSESSIMILLYSFPNLD